MIDINQLQEGILPSCCNLSAATVDQYPPEGMALISSFLPDSRTVLVLGHHVEASLEWAWFPFTIERGGNTCAADLHAKAMIEAIERRLVLEGYKSMILPYPDACGISFKRLAIQTGMGELGDSFLFLHHQWGPWVHLRVILTDALVADRTWDAKGICTHCGKCIEVCPGKALTIGKHDQKTCGHYQQTVRDRLMIKAKYRFKCEVCARVCPVAETPLEIVIQDKS